jgi:phosphopantetheine adenylyltransferase
MHLRYGTVICCIGVNPSKIYDVTPQDRAEILKEMVASNLSVSNVRVEGKSQVLCIKNVKIHLTSLPQSVLLCKVVSGYIWRYARTHKAILFYRGIRTWSEDGADELKLLIQNTYGPMLLGRIWPINTVFLGGDLRYRGVSSTLVRGLCGKIKENNDNHNKEKERCVEELKQLVPGSLVKRVVEVYGK